MQTPRPFVVFQNGTFRFVIHAYSLTAAHQLIAARIVDADTVTITAVRCKP